MKKEIEVTVCDKCHSMWKENRCSMTCLVCWIDYCYSHWKDKIYYSSLNHDLLVKLQVCDSCRERVKNDKYLFSPRPWNEYDTTDEWTEKRIKEFIKKFEKEVMDTIRIDFKNKLITELWKLK